MGWSRRTETAVDGFQFAPPFEAGSTVPGRPVWRVRIKGPVLFGIVEHATRSIVEKTFGWRAFCQQKIMAFKFDMNVADRLRTFDLDNRCAVHEMKSGDQEPVDEHGMQRGDH